MRLTGFQACRTDDCDELNLKIGSALCAHNIRFDRSAPKAERAVFNHAPLMNVSVNFLSYGVEAEVRADALGFYLLEVPLTGFSRTCFGDRKILSRPGMAVVAGPYKPFSTYWHDGCTKLLFKIDVAAVETYLAELLGEHPSSVLEFQMDADLCHGKSASLWRAIHLIVEELEAPDSLLNTGPAAHEHFERLLLWSLLNSLPNTYSANLQAPVAPAGLTHVLRAEDFIRAHIQDPIGLPDIARASGVGIRTLSDAFRRHHGLPPMKFVKIMRLDHIHRALLAAGPDETTVTQVAMDWGYYHLGRFSGDYKKRFGQLPSDTLRQKKL